MSTDINARRAELGAMPVRKWEAISEVLRKAERSSVVKFVES